MKLCEFSLTLFTVLLTFSCTLSLKTLSNKESMQIDNSKSTSFIIESRPNRSSLVNLKTKGSTLGYSFGMGNKNFLINAFYKSAMTIQGGEDHKIIFGARSMSVSSLSLSKNFKYLQQNQWRMVVQDNFNNNNTLVNGWDYGVTTKCGSFYHILGGFCQLSNKEIKKEVIDLPPHKLIKIEAFFHFIGNWKGETGFLRVNGQSYRRDPSYLWTYRCNRNKARRPSTSKTCGYEVCRLNFPISVTIPHIEQRLSVSFGSSLTNNIPCDASYGITDFRIYIQ